MMAARFLRHMMTLFVYPCLPEKYRSRWPWELPFEPPTLGLMSAYFFLVASVFFYAVSLMSFEREFTSRLTDALVDPRGTGEVGKLSWYGAIGFVSFIVTPKGFLLLCLALESIIRVYNTSVTATPLASVLVAGPLFLYEKVQGVLNSRKMTARYGAPDAPDRIHLIDNGIVVCSNRRHPDWDRLKTFSYSHRVFRLMKAGEGVEHGRPCFEYHLGLWPENEVIRSVISLDDCKKTIR